jgi:hypothetical protein
MEVKLLVAFLLFSPGRRNHSRAEKADHLFLNSSELNWHNFAANFLAAIFEFQYLDAQVGKNEGVYRVHASNRSLCSTD